MYLSGPRAEKSSGWPPAVTPASFRAEPCRPDLLGTRRFLLRDRLLTRDELGALADNLLACETATTDDGIRVVDVWETREVFDRFAEEQIDPYTREVGFKEEPEMRFYDVHNHLTAG